MIKCYFMRIKMSKIFIVSEGLLLLIFLVVAIQSYTHNRENDQFVSESTIAQIPLIIVPHNETFRRSLQQDNTPLHLFVIKGVISTSGQVNVQQGVIERIFKIASHYFSLTIKVKPLQQSSTLFPPNTKCGPLIVPQEFVTNGFNPNQIDLVYFIVLYQNSNDYKAATSGPCILRRRPIYGLTLMNIAIANVSLTKFGQFHYRISFLMHQMVHVLGFTSQLYELYYSSVSATTPIPKGQVYQKNPANQQQFMIVLPTVKAYVQKFFGCADKSMGSLLQTTGNKNLGSHWNQKVFYDEFLTSSQSQRGSRISQLTMSLLKDTGFYDEVDLTLVDDLQYGRNKGCTFAQGKDINASPELCAEDNAQHCDFYNTFKGTCSDSILFPTTENDFCQFPQYDDPNDSELHGASSRCLDYSSGKYSCQKARCIENDKAIQITVNSLTVKGCRDTDKQILPPQSNVTVMCPNKSVFCAVKACQYWCSTQGICINGQCIKVQQLILNCSSIDPYCTQCIRTPSSNLCMACSQNHGVSFNQSECVQTILESDHQQQSSCDTLCLVLAIVLPIVLTIMLMVICIVVYFKYKHTKLVEKATPKGQPSKKSSKNTSTNPTKRNESEQYIPDSSKQIQNPQKAMEDSIYDPSQ